MSEKNIFNHKSDIFWQFKTTRVSFLFPNEEKHIHTFLSSCSSVLTVFRKTDFNSDLQEIDVCHREID